jgi:hypothetical protein
MERECARGDPEALHEWKCDDCNDAALEAARIAEEEDRQALELATRLEAHERYKVRAAAQHAREQGERVPRLRHTN